jgi:hypothetical protein
MTEPATEKRPFRFVPNTPDTPPPRLLRFAFELIASTEQTLRNPERLTVATDVGEDDEWSEENMRRWERADKLDPELAEWLRALPRK